MEKIKKTKPISIHKPISVLFTFSCGLFAYELQLLDWISIRKPHRTFWMKILIFQTSPFLNLNQRVDLIVESIQWLLDFILSNWILLEFCIWIQCQLFFCLGRNFTMRTDLTDKKNKLWKQKNVRRWTWWQVLWLHGPGHCIRSINVPTNGLHPVRQLYEIIFEFSSRYRSVCRAINGIV